MRHKHPTSVSGLSASVETDALSIREVRDALVLRAQGAVRRWVPLPVRIERKRAMRYASWMLERDEMARSYVSGAEHRGFEVCMSSKRSPLKRGEQAGSAELQAAKETNVERVVRALDGLYIPPGGLFSYHHVVGRPSRSRGFVLGPELREGALSVGVGGGACQVTNMLFQLALLSGLDIVERHRHGLDLFPDNGRTVPFGCGATVFYNMADLRFRNTLPRGVTLSLSVRDGYLHGRVMARSATNLTVRVYEADHTFVECADPNGGTRWLRSNVIRRSFSNADGAVVRDDEVVRNEAETRYTPVHVDFGRRELTNDDFSS